MEIVLSCVLSLIISAIVSVTIVNIFGVYHLNKQEKEWELYVDKFTDELFNKIKSMH